MFFPTTLVTEVEVEEGFIFENMNELMLSEQEDKQDDFAIIATVQV